MSMPTDIEDYIQFKNNNQKDYNNTNITTEQFNNSILLFNRLADWIDENSDLIEKQHNNRLVKIF